MFDLRPSESDRSWRPRGAAGPFLSVWVRHRPTTPPPPGYKGETFRATAPTSSSGLSRMKLLNRDFMFDSSDMLYHFRAVLQNS